MKTSKSFFAGSSALLVCAYMLSASNGVSAAENNIQAAPVPLAAGYSSMAVPYSGNDYSYGMNAGGNGGVYGDDGAQNPYTEGDTLTFDSDSFSYNGAMEGSGGAIYNAASVEITGNSNFQMNTAGIHGGVIYGNNANITIDGTSVFESNSSGMGDMMSPGDGVERGNGGVIYADGGTITINNSNTFTKNSAGYYDGYSDVITNGSHSGGTIYSNGANITINNSNIFEQNFALENGGAIYAKGGTLNINDNNVFSSNRSEYSNTYGQALGGNNGGAIYSDNAVTKINGSNRFENNLSYENGGAIYAKNGKLDITGSNKFKGNHSGDYENDYGNGPSSTNGGAVYVDMAEVTISGDNRFESNMSDGSGGAIYTKGGTTNITGNYQEGNHNGSGTGNWAFKSNSSGSDSSFDGGGAIYAGSGSKIDIKNADFYDNSAAKAGGAINFNVGKTGYSSVINSYFYNNNAEDGGAIYIQNSAPTIDNVTVYGNNALKDGGGINIFSSSSASMMPSPTVIKNSTITKNTAGGNGGGIYNFGDIEISASTISENSANMGGGMYISSTDPNKIENVNFINNKSDLIGGGLTISSGTVQINDSKFEGNTAGTYGGAIAINQDYRSASSMEMVYIFDTDFINNKAEQYGGAISVDVDPRISFGVVQIASSDGTTHEFTGNTDSNGSNAIYIHQGNVKLVTQNSSDSTLKFNDGIQGTINSDTGEYKGTVEVSGIGSVIFNNTVKDINLVLNSGNLVLGETGNTYLADNSNYLDNVDLTLNGGTFNMANDKLDTLNIRDFTANNDVKISMDVDLSQGKSDLLNIGGTMSGNLSFDLDHFTMKIVNGDAEKFQFFNKAGGEFTFNGQITQFSNDKKYVFIANDDGSISILQDSSNGLNDAINADGERVFRPDPAGDIVLNLPLDTLKGDRLDIIMDNADLNGSNNTGFVISEGQTLSLSDIGTADGNKSLNSFKSENGGAVNNSGTVNITNSVLKNNEASADGGAVHNNGQAVIKNSLFTENKAVNGGAINNKAPVAAVLNIDNTKQLNLENSSFTKNEASQNGGAINNTGSINTSNVNFVSNTSGADGGAINNTESGVIYLEDTSFYNNTAGGNGGAINNNGTILNIKAAHKDVVFSGNTSNGTANDIYMSNSASSNAAVTFDGDKNTILNGGIAGEGTITKEGAGTLKLGGDNSNYHGDLVVNKGGVQLLENSKFLSAANSTFADGTSLNLINNQANDVNLGNLNLDGKVNVGVDVNMQNHTNDTLSADSLNGSGNLVINNVNVLTDKTVKDNSMSFDIIKTDELGNSPLLGHVSLDPNTSTTAFGPILKYGVGFDPSSGRMTLAGAPGRTSSSFNPSVLAAPVAAQVGGYLNQLNSYEQAFWNMDMTMLMTRAQRNAMKYRNKYAFEGDTNLTFSPTNNPQEEKGLWVRPYSTFETVGLKNGPGVSNVMYGSYFGGDSGLTELGNGWDGVFSTYIGYNGSHQAYNGVGIYQNGGTLGFTGTAYKGNFFTGLTANVGANVGDATTMYGNENFTMLAAGAAAKAGYNWELAEGKFIIQPSYMMSYSFINTFDYRNSAGVDIQSDPINAIQIAPGIKFIGNLKHGWQPYVGLTIVWNILDKTNFKANDVALPYMSVKPYFLYGVGVQKNWGDRFTGYLQAMFRSGGRNGVGFQAGFRYSI